METQANEVVSCRPVYREEDYLAASRTFRNAWAVRGYYALLWGFAGWTIVDSIIGTITMELPSPHNVTERVASVLTRGVMAIPIVLMIAIWVALAIVIVRISRRTRRMWVATANAGGGREMRFDTMGLEMTSAVQRARYRWDAFKELREAPGVMVFFLTRPLTFVIVPTRAMGAEALERVRGWWKDRAGLSPEPQAVPPPMPGEVWARTQIEWRDYRIVMWNHPVVGKWYRVLAILGTVWLVIALAITVLTARQWMGPMPPPAAGEAAPGVMDRFGWPIQAGVMVAMSAGIQAWMYRNWQRQLRHFADGVTVRVSEAGVGTYSPRQVLELTWEAMTHVVVTKKGVLFCFGVNQAVILPARYLNAESLGRVVGWWQSRGKGGVRAFPVEVGRE